jgi:hypothetical protein
MGRVERAIVEKLRPTQHTLVMRDSAFETANSFARTVDIRSSPHRTK